MPVPVFRLSFKNILKTIGKGGEAQMGTNQMFVLFRVETKPSLVAAEECCVKGTIKSHFHPVLEHTTTTTTYQCFS